MRRARGFNLTEGLVAVAVLAIVAAAAAPSMADWVRAWQVRGLAESVRDGLQKARMEAMKRNQAMGFWLVAPPDAASPGAECARSATSAAWVVSIDDPSGNCDERPSPTANPRLFEKFGPGPTPVRVAGRAAGGGAANAVGFNGFGQAVGAVERLACVDVSHAAGQARQLRVEISASGAIRLCDRGVTAPDLRACSNPAPCANAT